VKTKPKKTTGQTRKKKVKATGKAKAKTKMKVAPKAESRKPKAEPRQPPLRLATDDDCWLVIEAARARDAHDVAAQVIEALGARDIADMVRFQQFVDARVREAYRWDLWAVAYVMNGGCSDDGFDYFLGWLIGRGRARWKAALADAEAAADGADPDDEPFESEELLAAASIAYRRKMGEEDVTAFYARVPAAGAPRGAPAGERFDENTVAEKHPKLAQRFGMA